MSTCLPTTLITTHRHPRSVTNPLTVNHPDDLQRRYRSVGTRIVSGLLGPSVLPALADHLRADWQRDLVTQVPLTPGDVNALSLARARRRWPAYRATVQAVADWLQSYGVCADLNRAETALMACRGAHYHHDATQYSGSVFCNLFLTEDRGQDVHFPHAGLRVPLRYGTVLLFDTGQPHAVIRRSAEAFDPAHFCSPAHSDAETEADSDPYPENAHVFLTWEIPIADTGVAAALDIESTDHCTTCEQPAAAHLCWHGRPVDVCPFTGTWRPF